MGRHRAEQSSDAEQFAGPSAFLQFAPALDARNLSKRTLSAASADVLLLDARDSRPSVVYRAIVRARNSGWDRGIVLMVGSEDLAMVPVASSIGATDFMLSSASPEEVEARLRWASGQPEANVQGAVVNEIGIELHWRTHQVRFEGTSISLSLREMQLLAVFMERAGVLISAADLSRVAWGKGRDPGSGLTAAYVCSLRKKLAWFGGRFGIQTVRAVGYRFVM
jgi:DNA-binding response OmpR family regulator